MSFIVMYEDVEIVEFYERTGFQEQPKHESFEEAKESLIAYWENRLQDSKRNIKEAKQVKLAK